MNVKKFLSVALAVVMIVLACPLSIFAADGDLVLETYDANGEVASSESYSTFAAAIAALDTLYDNVPAGSKTSDEALYAAAGKPVIRLTGDFTAAATEIPWNNTTDIDNAAVRTIVIDGDNGEGGRYTVSYSTTNTKLFTKLGITNFYAKNIQFDMSFTGGDGAMDWGGSGVVEQIETDTTFENCIINYTYTGGANDGCLFKMNGKRKANVDATGLEDTVTGDIFNLNLVDCTITQQGALGIQIHWGADANIKIENTYWLRNGNSYDYNHSFVRGYDCGDITVNVDGTSTLESKISSGSNGGTFFYATNTSAYGLTVTLEQGATLYMNDQIDGGNTALVDADSTSLKIIDKGAVWKIGTTAATYGVKTESVMGGNGNMIGFKLGGTDVTGTYTASEAPAEALVLSTYELDHAAQDYAVYVTDEAGNVKGYYKNIETTFGILGNHDVIHLMKDVIFTKGEQRPTSSNGYTVTIDGTKATDGAGNVTERYKITQPYTTYNPYAFEVGNINFTLSNVILQATKGLRYHADDTANYTYATTLNNVEMNITAGLGFKIGQVSTKTGSRTYNITINDSVINHSATDAVFNSSDIAKYNIIIHNTEITRTKGTGSGNGFIFNLFNPKGGTIHLTGDTEMNVLNDATNWCGIVYAHPTNPTAAINVILDAGVKLNLLSTTTTSKDTEFFYSTWDNTNKKAALTVTDHGAIYTVSAQVAKLGVQLPSITGMPYTFAGGATTTVSGNRYYGDEMVPVSAYIADLNGPSNTENASGGRTDFYIPDATGNVTFTNKVIAPELYNNDPSVAMLRKDAEGNVLATYTESQFNTANSAMQTGETLVLLRDILVSGAYYSTGAKSYTIDGQGKYGLIQVDGVGNYAFYAPTQGNTVTFKDMTLNLMGGFWFDHTNAQNVVLDNVLMTSGAPRALMALRTTAGVKNLYITNGSVVTVYTTPGSANVSGGAIVVDDSVLRMAVNANVINNPGNCSISFVNGGSLAYTAKALASAGDTGVTLPGAVDENGDAITKWVVNGELQDITTYANASATEDVVLTPLTSLFTTLDGASIRVDDPAGIRFEAWFDDALLALDGVEVGILLTVKTDTLTDETFVLDGEGKANGQAVIDQVGGQFKEDGTDNLLRVVLANIGEESYDVQFAARAYVKLGGVTYYAGFDGENVRSLKAVAIAAIQLPAYADNAFLQGIANS